MCNIRNVCISFVLSTFCYMLYVVCCALCVIPCAKCVYFLGFKHISGNGAMHQVLWAICYILYNIRIRCISLVLSSFCYVLCVVYSVPCVVHSANCVYFRGFKHIYGIVLGSLEFLESGIVDFTLVL